MIGSLSWERTQAQAGDPVAAWALDAAPAAAAWLLGAAPRPAPDATPAPALLRRYAVDHGRVSARVALPDPTGFTRGFIDAVREDTALVRWCAPLLAAGLFGVAREERRDTLDGLPELLRDPVRAHFERQRALGRADVPVVTGACRVVEAVRDGEGAMRSQVCQALAAAAGAVWLDELTVLARGDVRAWTIGAPDEYATAALSWWQTVGMETAA